MYSEKPETASVMLPLDRFPQIQHFAKAWRVIREEALDRNTVTRMNQVLDWRSSDARWTALPLRVEEEDKDALSDEICFAAREALPRTFEILSAVDGVTAFAISSLAPGGHIRPHEHGNACATGTVCLQDGGDAWFSLEGERHRYVDGETFVFDYRRQHAVTNRGSKDRVVALILVDLESSDDEGEFPN